MNNRQIEQYKPSLPHTLAIKYPLRPSTIVAKNTSFNPGAFILQLWTTIQRTVSDFPIFFILSFFELFEWGWTNSHFSILFIKDCHAMQTMYTDGLNLSIYKFYCSVLRVLSYNQKSTSNWTHTKKIICAQKLWLCSICTIYIYLVYKNITEFVIWFIDSFSVSLQ